MGRDNVPIETLKTITLAQREAIEDKLRLIAQKDA